MDNWLLKSALVILLTQSAIGQKDWRKITNGPNGPRGGAITIKPGEEMADLTAIDETGEPFALSQLKGKYSVLIFGCLT